MRLVASAIVRNERGRYLEPWLDHLLGFCDGISILDDASTDDTHDLLLRYARRAPVYLTGAKKPMFSEHEGRARQRLVDWTVSDKPDWVLSLDADEFVSDGAWLRQMIEAHPNTAAFSLDITEIWSADDDWMLVRQDGGWRTHPLTCLWRVQAPRYDMLDKKLACRRVPKQVLEVRNVPRSDVDLLHFGWTDPATRQQRYDRYMQIDGGRFHASSHLQSIMWPERRMRLEHRGWPEGKIFDALRERFSKAAA